MLKPVFLALISMAVCSAQAPSTAQQKGSISGTVTSLAGEPLKSARLTLQEQPGSQNAARGAPSPQQGYAAASDAQGNFTFDDLEPGHYTLSSERAGYLRIVYTASSSGPTAVLDLTSGQTLTGISIRMTPQALISGRVTDENGDPYPNIRVNLARWAYAGGQKRLQTSNGGGTDAEGNFSIGDLAAGSYYVTASAQPVVLNNAIQKGPEETYVNTYYPGVTDPSGAIPVQVTAGGIVRGTEIRMRKVQAYRVRGKLAGRAGEAVQPNSSLRLTSKDGTNLRQQLVSSVLRDGSFNFERVIPGTYILETQGGGPNTSGMARQIVTVGGADVDDIVLSLMPGAEITGQISIDGAGPPHQAQQPGTPGVNAQPAIVLSSDTIGNRGQTNDDGTFAIHKIMPAVYQVSVQPLPQGTYVKSIRFGSQDLMKTALDLTGGSGGTLNVVLSPNAGDISGVVHGADGTPLWSVLVTLWTPGIPAEGVTDFTKIASTDVNGQFKFASLPPGDYRIAAWEQIEPGLATVPEFRIKFESKAAAVKLDENGHENTETPLIGRDAIEAEAAKLQ
jgi:protocatechuate 3,4-dioxygenase beta subunit